MTGPVTPGMAMNSDARKRAAEAASGFQDPGVVERERAVRAAAARGHVARLQAEVRLLQGRLARVAEFHAVWGDTEVNSANYLVLWERLGRILEGDDQ